MDNWFNALVAAGGPAFPFPDVQGPSPQSLTGMSLRDYFAAMALPTIISLTQSHTGQWDDVAVAAGAYQVADAMLKARE